MKQIALTLDRRYSLGGIDPRLYGSFVEHLGRAVYEGVYQPASPLADGEGFRSDVMALVRELQVPIVRYPGGNFVSAYRWEDTVGPKNLRPQRADPAWKTIETNQFGMNEFFSWCKKVGTEPMMAVNFGTRGIDEARDVLEYCNLTGGTYYSDLRRSHGYEKPHGVKVWCLGNEMDGPWQIGQKTAGAYGRMASQASRVMRALDPNIQLVACGSSTASMSSFGSWEMGMLDECYEDVDYLSMHAYYGKFTGDTLDLLASPVEMDRFIEGGVAICDAMQAKKHSAKKLHISFDEWNVNYHFRMSRSDPAMWRDWYLHSSCFEDFYGHFRSSLPKNPPYDWEIAPHRLEDVYTLEDAVAFGGLLISLLRHADRVKIACQAQLVNVIAPILTDESRAWRQSIFYPYFQASRYGRGEVLETRLQTAPLHSEAYGDVPGADVAAVLAPDGDGLILFAVNRDPDQPRELVCDLRQFTDWRVTSHTELYDDDVLAANTADAPLRIQPKEVLEQSGLAGGILHSVLKKHSWNVIRLQAKNAGVQ